jgi:hypothetical protein
VFACRKKPAVSGEDNEEEEGAVACCCDLCRGDEEDSGRRIASKWEDNLPDGVRSISIRGGGQLLSQYGRSGCVCSSKRECIQLLVTQREKTRAEHDNGHHGLSMKPRFSGRTITVGPQTLRQTRRGSPAHCIEKHRLHELRRCQTSWRASDKHNRPCRDTCRAPD